MNYRNAYDFCTEEMQLGKKHSKIFRTFSEILCIAVAQGYTFTRKKQTDLQIAGNHAVLDTLCKARLWDSENFVTVECINSGQFFN